MVISELVKEIADSLGENARFEAELIVMNALSLTRTQFVFSQRDEAKTDSIADAMSMTERRKKGEPLQYILGECEFMSLPFHVEEGVLIPRSDTEVLVEEVVKYAAKSDAPKILDICTGSGCIGISIAHYVPSSRVDLIDISDIALKTARINIEKNGVSDRVFAKKLDILSDIPTDTYDIIVSNPPYIETDVIATLQTEVRDFEPHLALDGGEDGLTFYRRIANAAPKILTRGGLIAFEIGYNQADALRKIMSQSFCDVQIIKDLCGNDRVAAGFLK